MRAFSKRTVKQMWIVEKILLCPAGALLHSVHCGFILWIIVQWNLVAFRTDFLMEFIFQVMKNTAAHLTRICTCQNLLRFQSCKIQITTFPVSIKPRLWAQKHFYNYSESSVHVSTQKYRIPANLSIQCGNIFSMPFSCCCFFLIVFFFFYSLPSYGIF